MTHRWSLRTRFVLFAMACLLPLFLVAWFFLDRSNERNTEQVTNNERTVFDVVNRSLTTFLDSTETTLANIGQQQPIEDAILNFDRAGSDALLGEARLFNRDLNGLFVVNENLMQVSGSELTTDFRKSIEPQLQQTILSGTTSISGVLTLDDGSRVLVLVVPVTTGVDAMESAAVTPTVTPASDLTQLDPTQGTDDTAKSPGENIGAIGAIIQTSAIEQRVLPFPTGNTEIAITNGQDVLLGTDGAMAEATDFVLRRSDVINRALGGSTDSMTLEDASGTFA